MQEKTLPKQKIRTSNIYTTEFGSVSYDIFGSPYQKTGSFLADDSLDFGYLGKPYNADTELYDYGFRDYSPTTARFTTIDPIRDGRNWFSYVVNDPVNYVDLWGLCGSENDGKKLTDEQLATANFFLGESINGTPINYDDINIYNYAADAETLRKLAENIDHPEERAAVEEKYLASAGKFDHNSCMDRMEQMVVEAYEINKQNKLKAAEEEKENKSNKKDKKK